MQRIEGIIDERRILAIRGRSIKTKDVTARRKACHRQGIVFERKTIIEGENPWRSS